MGMVGEAADLDSVDRTEEGPGPMEVQGLFGITSRAEVGLAALDSPISSSNINMVLGVQAGTALQDQDQEGSLVVALLGNMVARTYPRDPHIIGILITVYHMALLATNSERSCSLNFRLVCLFALAIFESTHDVLHT
jgi:hypothetical protein